MEDEPATFDPNILMIMFALGGVLIAWESAYYRGQRASDTGQRRFMGLYGLAFLIANAFEASERWSGFAYLIFMPVGAYKVAHVLTWWAVWVCDALGWLRPFPLRGRED